MLVVAGVSSSGKRVSNRMMAGVKIIAVAMIPFSIARSRALPFHYESRSWSLRASLAGERVGQPEA